MIGRIHSVETFGTVDGPGVRYVVFMQGCPMRCLYCHNPDTWEFDGGAETDAIALADDVKKYSNYLSGGVTVSGGEPLAQIDFVIELFKILKKRGIHTAVDTSGITFDSGNTEKFDELINYCDLFLLDIKHIDNDKHVALTRHSNERPLALAKYLSERGKDLWIRHVLVTGYTDDDDSLLSLSSFIKTLKTVKKIEVLPYHDMGKEKYEKLNLKYPLKDIDLPTEERILAARRILNLE